jgi:hypothetical protein
MGRFARKCPAPGINQPRISAAYARVEERATGFAPFAATWTLEAIIPEYTGIRVSFCPIEQEQRSLVMAPA